MTDYGVRKKPKRLPLLGMAIVIGGLIVLAVVHFGLELRRPQWLAEARHWTVQGPACAPVSRAAFLASRIETPEALDYDEVSYRRSSGHASCAQIHDQGGRGFGLVDVCQFSSPNGLVVRTGKTETYYIATIGQPLAISIDHGVQSCVLGTTEWAPPGG